MAEWETIEGIFRNLDVYLAQLRELSDISQASLESDLIRQGAVKYYLQVAVECCIDVANHIIAREGFRAPKSYADSFAVLAEHEIIGPEFANTAQSMARMRNRLVHLYWEVDAEILYQVLQNNLNDFEKFKERIHAFLRKKER